MRRALFITVGPGEAWAALCEDGAPVEFGIARSESGPRPGDLILGRIVGLDPALPAAFVEIGAARPGFLSAEDAEPRTGLAGLAEGDAVVVQVIKEARADKAAGLTLRPRLEGALLDLRPGRPGVAAARGRAPAERVRPEVMLAAIAAPDEGLVLRPGAEDASEAELAADAALLRARWQAVEASLRHARPPARLEPEATPATALLGEFAAAMPQRIVIDDRAGFAAARQWLLRHRPALTPALALHAASPPLFEAEGVADAVAAALAPRVALACGGALTIEATAAATMIDVDSGSAAPMAANRDAAREAARQIRLRNLAGPIVIDFISMSRPEERARVHAMLAEALASDPARPQLLGWTRLGHMELMRPRRRAALDEILFERGGGGGRLPTALTVALAALKAVVRAADAAPARAFGLAVAPDVARCLETGAARPARQELETRLGRTLALAPEPGRPRDSFDIGAL
jgi:ribonuclease G